MPRLIEIDKTKEKVVTHTKCGAKIGYFLQEVQDGGIHHDYGGGSDKWFFIICPNCGAKVEVSKY